MAARLLLLALAVPAAGFRLRKQGQAGSKSNSSLLPFECYVDKGAAYVGLKEMGESGRQCKNWLEQETYAPSVAGIGNHHYCRNPQGSKDRPWCFTVDPLREWEYCEVPQCPENGADPVPWTAPPGSKSAEEEAKGPCTHTPPDKPGFVEYEAGRACMDRRGDTVWLISNSNFTANDPAACKSECLTLPGTKFFTFWTDASGGNCGCYRTCVLKDQNITVDSPTVYKLV
mmetsp:Transcript_84606/g.218029  ORF Transcript_84606/g.218029 Transcript_84606/m.218029 type:complete len:229 (+) Transcript_84606:153-839(+)